MTGYCIECGAWQMDDDPEYDQWGGYDIGGGWVQLCPGHYKKYHEEHEKLMKLTKRRTFIRKILSKIFKKTVKWMEDVAWGDGHFFKEKCLEEMKKMDFKRLKDDIIEGFKSRIHLYSSFSDKEIEHVEKILKKYCILCKHYYEYDNCLGYGDILYTSIVREMRKGNYGCPEYKYDKRLRY